MQTVITPQQRQQRAAAMLKEGNMCQSPMGSEDEKRSQAGTDVCMELPSLVTVVIVRR